MRAGWAPGVTKRTPCQDPERGAPHRRSGQHRPPAIPRLRPPLEIEWAQQGSPREPAGQRRLESRRPMEEPPSSERRMKREPGRDDQQGRRPVAEAKGSSAAERELHPRGNRHHERGGLLAEQREGQERRREPATAIHLCQQEELAEEEHPQVLGAARPRQVDAPRCGSECCGDDDHRQAGMGDSAEQDQQDGEDGEPEHEVRCMEGRAVETEESAENPEVKIA